LGKATRQVDTEAHTAYYLIASATTPGVSYEVRFNRQYHCLQCLPQLDGPPCQASAQGLTYWHKRSALCREAEYAILKLAAKQAEQFEVEATPEYQQEQLEFTLEVASRRLHQAA